MGLSVSGIFGRNPTLASEQESDRYDSKQQSASAGGSFTFGSMTGSANVSASRDRMHSTWQSVEEQTGIFAGKGGFDVTVGAHTQLDGAVIGSIGAADKNRLETGTLGWNDIENHADYKVEHQSAGISTGGSIAGQFAGNMANGLLVGANQTLSPIFDKEREQNRLQEAQLIGEIGNQAADIARTEEQIAGEKAKRDPAALQAAKEALVGKGNLNPTADQIAEEAYNTAMAPFGTGSSLQKGIQAATAAVQGLAGGNIGQAVSGAVAPYLAEQIHKLTEGNPEAKAMAHAVLGAVTSYASGNSALAGAAGGVSGELMAQLVMKQLYPGKAVGDLTETEKQTISALGTLAAGLAGGVAGDGTADAVAGAQAERNAVENNSLSGDKARETVKQAAESLKDQVRDKLGEGTTSSIVNAIINGLADTGDAALGGADYVADAAMALAACAAGDSYCGTALNDLAGKNQAVADSVKALMQSETWSAVADTIKQASEGNQLALEATGGMLAGIILPGKKVPHLPNAGAVGNMKEFLAQPGLGTQIKNSAQKSSQIYQGQSIYKANSNIGEVIKKGDQFYFDGQHKNHLEVFDNKGKFKAVLNLDGAINKAKTEAAKGRKI